MMRPVPAAVLDLPTVSAIREKVHLRPREAANLARTHTGVDCQHDDRIEASASALRGCFEKRSFFLVESVPDLAKRLSLRKSTSAAMASHIR